MSTPQEYYRDYEYVAYIDEAGDPGLRRIQTSTQPGASEWFILGCALVRKSFEPEIPKVVGDWLSNLSITQRQHLHYRDLSPSKKAAACRLVSENRNVLFVVCSHKRNIEGYRNDRAAAKSQDPDWFYNFMTRLLLERVTNFVRRDSLEKHGSVKKLRLEFASRSLKRFSELGAYLERVRIQTIGKTLVLNKRTIEPDVFDVMQIRSYRAIDRAGLQIADIVASAFYDAVNYNTNGVCNPENAKLLMPRIAFDKTIKPKRFAEYGVVLQPTRPTLPGLDFRQREIFEFYGYQF